MSQGRESIHGTQCAVHRITWRSREGLPRCNSKDGLPTCAPPSAPEATRDSQGDEDEDDLDGDEPSLFVGVPNEMSVCGATFQYGVESTYLSPDSDFETSSSSSSSMSPLNDEIRSQILVKLSTVISFRFLITTTLSSILPTRTAVSASTGTHAHRTPKHSTAAASSPLPVVNLSSAVTMCVSHGLATPEGDAAIIRPTASQPSPAVLPSPAAMPAEEKIMRV
jgi:hypothetical protein